MTHDYAFIGDIHGNFEALIGLLDVLSDLEVSYLVFLGDYVNRGPDSSRVLDLLIDLTDAGHATLLAGNHELELLSALDSGNMTRFLKMGGATTIRSYLGRPVEEDVHSDFRAHIPDRHIQAMRIMQTVWESENVRAQHLPFSSPDPRFSVTAHTPVGPVPRITGIEAQIDTGMGEMNGEGRLTALLWPSREYIQVDRSGHRTG